MKHSIWRNRDWCIPLPSSNIKSGLTILTRRRNISGVCQPNTGNRKYYKPVFTVNVTLLIHDPFFNTFRPRLYFQKVIEHLIINCYLENNKIQWRLSFYSKQRGDVGMFKERLCYVAVLERNGDHYGVEKQL